MVVISTDVPIYCPHAEWWGLSLFGSSCTARPGFCAVVGPRGSVGSLSPCRGVQVGDVGPRGAELIGPCFLHTPGNSFHMHVVLSSRARHRVALELERSRSKERYGSCPYPEK